MSEMIGIYIPAQEDSLGNKIKGCEGCPRRNSSRINFCIGGALAYDLLKSHRSRTSVSMPNLASECVPVTIQRVLTDYSSDSIERDGSETVEEIRTIHGDCPALKAPKNDLKAKVTVVAHLVTEAALQQIKATKR